jgi:hypothetical protein
MNNKKFWKVGLTSLAVFLAFSLAFFTFPNNLLAQTPPGPPNIDDNDNPPGDNNDDNTDGPVSPSQEWTATITARSLKSGKEVTVTFGINSEATSGNDAGLDETVQLPPPAFGQSYLDLGFDGPGMSYLKKDIRDSGPWELTIQSSDNFVLSWDISSVPADYPLSIDDVDMTEQSSKTFSDGRYVLIIEKSIEIIVTPSSGSLGTEITVDGTNFGPEEDVVIDFGTAKDVAQATTDAEGSFSGVTFLAVPQPAEEPVIVKATSATSDATAVFDYVGPSIDSVEVVGSPVVLGGEITVTAKCQPEGMVKFSIDGVVADIEMSEAPDNPGTYVSVYKVSDVAEGIYNITATLTDAADNMVSMTLDNALEVSGATKFVVTLAPGANLLHIPVADSRFEKISDLFQFLVDEGVEIQMLIYYNNEIETFQSYGSWSIPDSAEDIMLESDTGMIAVVKSTAQAKSVTFEGGMYEDTDVMLLAGEKGINLVGLPANDPDISTLGELATAVGDSLVTLISQDETGKFVSSIEVPDLGVCGDDAFIAIVNADTTLKLEGEPWSKPQVAATPTLPIDRDWSRSDVMVVQGNTVLERNYEPLSGLNITVQNLSTGISQTGISGNLTKDGKYSVVFVNLSGSPIAKAGELLRISADDPTGKFSVEPIQHRITEEDIKNGIIVTQDLLLTKIPEHSALLQNYPNPFNPETWIPFQLSQSADVTLKIYDLSGQVIRKIDIGYKPAGTYTSSRKAIYWDGRNNFGEKVASGIYFYAVEAGSFNATRKMIIVK